MMQQAEVEAEIEQMFEEQAANIEAIELLELQIEAHLAGQLESPQACLYAPHPAVCPGNDACSCASHQLLACIAPV